MTDLLRLKAENHRLKVENWRMRMQIFAQGIDRDGKDIEAECLAGEPTGSTFDWETLLVCLPKADNTSPKD